MENQTGLEKQQKKLDYRKLDKVGFWFLFFGFVFILVGPWLLTRNGFIDFTHTGEIGDTIGGITSPVVSLIGAALVYLSFRVQIKANEITSKALLSQLTEQEYSKSKIQLNEIFNQTNKFWNELKFSNGKVTKKVFDYLNIRYNLFRNKNYSDNKDFIVEHSVQFRKLLLAMKYFHYYYDEVKNCNLNESDKDILLDQLTFLLFENFTFFITFSKNFKKDPLSNNITNKLSHEIYTSYFNLYDKIIIIRNELISLKGYGLDVENNPEITVA